MESDRDEDARSGVSDWEDLVSVCSEHNSLDSTENNNSMESDRDEDARSGVSDWEDLVSVCSEHSESNCIEYDSVDRDVDLDEDARSSTSNFSCISQDFLDDFGFSSEDDFDFEPEVSVD
jgi:hypothetical protein